MGRIPAEVPVQHPIVNGTVRAVTHAVRDNTPFFLQKQTTEASKQETWQGSVFAEYMADTDLLGRPCKSCGRCCLDLHVFLRSPRQVKGQVKAACVPPEAPAEPQLRPVGMSSYQWACSSDLARLISTVTLAQNAYVF